MTVRNRTELLQAFCKANTLELMTTVAQDALDTMAAGDAVAAVTREKANRLAAQVERQIQTINGLEAALKSDNK